MTEKTLLVDNPFSLESNPKKLVQRLEVQEKLEKTYDMAIEERLYSKTRFSSKFGLIRALDEEAEKMAKAREETLARDQKREGDRKKSKNAPLWESTDGDIRKQMNRINNILKEKRETIAEFVKKKREICLSNMNIFNKKEETERLEDFIKNEKESLKARKYYFENDWAMVNKFIKEVEADASEASKEAEKQQKEKEKNKEKLNSIYAEVERTDQKISRKIEEYENLLKYKNFIDGISEKYSEVYGTDYNYLEDKRQQLQQSMLNNHTSSEGNLTYLTQHPDDGKAPTTQSSVTNGEAASLQKWSSKFVIPLKPSQLKDILSHIQEKNLYLCQNNNESEEVYENKKRDKNDLKESLLKQQQENSERIKELEKQRDIALRQNQSLMSLKKFNVSKVQITEGEDLDMQKIAEKIYQIIKCVDDYEMRLSSRTHIENVTSFELYQQLVDDLNSKEMRKQMHKIEKKLESISKYRDSYMKESDENAKRVAEIEKSIKQQQSREKQTEINKLTVTNLEKKLKDRERNLENRRKGRVIMTRSLLQKPVVVKKEESDDDHDDDEKYFKEEYDLGNDVLKQDKKSSTMNLNTNDPALANSVVLAAASKTVGILANSSSVGKVKRKNKLQ